MLTEQLLKVANLGAEWVLWVLLVLSFVSVGAIVDRWWFFFRRPIDVEQVGQTLVAHLGRGELPAAKQLLEAHPSVEAQVIRKCLDWAEDGPEAMSEALQAALREARPQLEKSSVMLGTIGNNAPFVGLLGTVLGVVQAFAMLGQDAMNAMGGVMAGISEALVATGVGIAVALPAVVAFNVFSTKASEVEERARGLMNLIQAQQKSVRGKRPLEAAAVPLRAAEQ
jgi:biopolymer transport protein ExbB/TolQ